MARSLELVAAVLFLAALLVASTSASSQNTNMNQIRHSMKRQATNATEFKVSQTALTDVASVELFSSVAANAYGDVLIVWAVVGALNSSGKITGRLYTENGTAVAKGGEFLVANAAPTSAPSASALSSGNFIVTWALNSSVFARLFSTSGAALGNPFTIFTSANQVASPKVRVLANGSVLVVWTDLGVNQSSNLLMGKILTAFATPASGIIKITEFPSLIYESCVAPLSDGTALVIASMDQVGTPNLYGVVVARNGSVVTKQFAVNPFTLDHYSPSCAGITNGNAFVAWSGRVESSNTFNIFGTFLNPQDPSAAVAFNINNSTTNATSPSVAALPNGNIFVTWIEHAAAGEGMNIYGQLYLSNGAPVATPYLVAQSLSTTSRQSNPASFALRSEKVFIAWSSQTFPIASPQVTELFGIVIAETSWALIALPGMMLMAVALLFNLLTS